MPFKALMARAWRVADDILFGAMMVLILVLILAPRPANAQNAGCGNAVRDCAGIPYSHLLASTELTIPINMSTAAAMTLVPGVANQSIYVTSWDAIAGGTTNFSLVYGDDANCATNQTALTGPYPLTAQAGIAKGDGAAPVLIVPKGKYLCGKDSAAIQVSGSLSHTQF